MYQLAIVAVAAFAMTACGNKANGGGDADSTATEQTAETGQEAVDESLLETDFFSVKLPEGWLKNGSPSKYKIDVRTDKYVPPLYATIEVVSYINSMDEWKEKMNKDVKKADAVTIGNITFEAMDKTDSAFYTLYLGSMLDDPEQGILQVTLHGDAKKDKAEQIDKLKEVLNVLKMK